MISQYLGFDSDYIIIGLSAVVLILLILIIVNIAQMRKLKKAYKVFMSGKNGAAPMASRPGGTHFPIERGNGTC